MYLKLNTGILPSIEMYYSVVLSARKKRPVLFGGMIGGHPPLLLLFALLLASLLWLAACPCSPILTMETSSRQGSLL